MKGTQFEIIDGSQKFPQYIIIPICLPWTAYNNIAYWFAKFPCSLDNFTTMHGKNMYNAGISAFNRILYYRTIPIRTEYKRFRRINLLYKYEFNAIHIYRIMF